MKTQNSIYTAGVRLLLASVCFALGACSPFAPAQRMATPADTPQYFSSGSDTSAPASLWWTEFESAELNQLVERALERNTSIQEAWARLRQNSAFERMERSALMPTLDYSADAAHTRQGQNDAGVSTAEEFGLALAGSYELDLWGRVRANVRAGELGTMASMADVHAARISVVATVAQTWAELETQKAILPLVRRQWEAGVAQVELLVRRYVYGAANSKDLLEQEQEVAQLRTSMEDIAEAIAQLQYELAVLCGDMPHPELSMAANSAAVPQGLAPLPPVAGIGVPAEMLRQRPDVRAAALRLQEADWSVAASRAELLPTLRLSANGALSSAHLNELLDNWLASLAAGVTGPAFDAGRRRAEVDRTMAVVEERLAAYRDTVLTAVQEVETALEQERRARTRLREVQRSSEFQRQIYVQQQGRFLNGDDTLVSLLNARQSLDASLQNELFARYDVYAARIALHRALGGRVTPRQEPEPIERVSDEQ